MLIREATEADLEAIRTLNQHLHPDDPALPCSDLRSSWQAMLANPAIHCLVVESSGQLIATCTLIIVPNLTRSARPYALIENVVTHADHRRKGVGTALLKAALDMAWSQGCYKVMLMTSSRKEETLRFYEQAGFARGLKTAFLARPTPGRQHT